MAGKRKALGVTSCETCSAHSATDANWGIRALNRGTKKLEEDVFESIWRGFSLRVQERGVIGRRGTTQRVSPGGKRRTASPVGVPVLSRGRKASRSSKSRTERNKVTREIIPDDLGTG